LYWAAPVISAARPAQSRQSLERLDFFDWREQQKQSFEQMAIACNSSSY